MLIIQKKMAIVNLKKTVIKTKINCNCKVKEGNFFNQKFSLLSSVFNDRISRPEQSMDPSASS